MTPQLSMEHGLAYRDDEERRAVNAFANEVQNLVDATEIGDGDTVAKCSRCLEGMFLEARKARTMRATA